VNTVPMHWNTRTGQYSVRLLCQYSPASLVDSERTMSWDKDDTQNPLTGLREESPRVHSPTPSATSSNSLVSDPDREILEEPQEGADAIGPGDVMEGSQPQPSAVPPLTASPAGPPTPSANDISCSGGIEGNHSDEKVPNDRLDWGGYNPRGQGSNPSSTIKVKPKPEPKPTPKPESGRYAEIDGVGQYQDLQG